MTVFCARAIVGLSFAVASAFGILGCGSTHEMSAVSKHDALGSCSAPQNLKASYVREGADLGRIELTWDARSEALSPMTIAAAMNDEAREKETVPSGATRHLTALRVQESRSADGAIQLEFAIEQPCADGTTATAKEQIVLNDPIRDCTIAELTSVQAHASEFYSCAEQWANHGRGCGADGYLLGYGEKYSGRFMKRTRARVSSVTQAWLDSTLICLQTELRATATVATSCKEIKDTAYAQHTPCWIDSGVCDVPVRDLLKVVHDVDVKDQASWKAVSLMKDVSDACGPLWALGLVTAGLL